MLFKKTPSKFWPRLKTERKSNLVTPSTQTNLFPKLIWFFHAETHKISTSLTKFPPPYRGEITFHHTSHVMNRCIPHVHRARPLNGSKTVRIWKTIAITRPRTRSAAVRHWRDLSLSAYERDLVTNEKVQFRSLDANRTFENSFFSLASIEQLKEAVDHPRWGCRV